MIILEIVIIILLLGVLALLGVLYWQLKSKEESGGLKREFLQIEKLQERTERELREEIGRFRGEVSKDSKTNRGEMSQYLISFSDALQKRVIDLSQMQKQQLDSLMRLSSEKLDKVNDTIEKKLFAIQQDTNEKLEKMRATVDEKLHDTLEKRLGDSFKQVSERLELVHKGLGEMRTLASGVGDLKKVLSNVKVRGNWGEVQLEQLLDQILTNKQYAKNVQTKRGEKNERVEFAILLPGKDEDIEHIFLPIDAKFPLDIYSRLLEMEDKVDKEGIQKANKDLESFIKEQAKKIKDLYLDPPYTTDFAIMFLPVEGLYAEVLRRPGLTEELQQKYRVMVAGPTTISAMLNSLQMGFRTLAIEKRTSEVWRVLGDVKREFGSFGDILEKTKKKLQEATNQIDQGERRVRVISRSLRKVEELPGQESSLLEEVTTIEE
jgi:DNA recombination protein RmuC